MELVELCKISEKYAMDDKVVRPKTTSERKGLSYSRSIRKKGERRIQRSRSKSLPALPMLPPKPFTSWDFQPWATYNIPQPEAQLSSSPESDNESVRIRQFSTNIKNKKGLVNKGDLRMEGRRDSGVGGMNFRRDSSISVSSTCMNAPARRDSVLSEVDSSRRNSSFATNYCTPLRRTSCITEREYKRLGHKFSFSLPGSKDSILDENPSEYQVLVAGAVGVGKSAIISQFTTSDFLGTSDVHTDAVAEKTSISVILNKEESVIELLEESDLESFRESSEEDDVDAYMIVYSCIDRNSFRIANNALKRLKEDGVRKTVMLVANKVDLVRKRQVNYEEGRVLAHAYSCKYIETSAALNHNVDELLAGVLSQIRLKEYGQFMRENNDIGAKKQQQHKGITRVIKTAFKGVFGKKQKNSRCENLYEI